MNKRLCLLVLLFILMPCSSVVAQFIDVQDLSDELVSKSMSEMQAAMEEDSEVQPLTQTKEEQETGEDGELMNETMFEDAEYGYTGTRSFSVDPQIKFFEDPLKYFGYNYFIQAPTTFAPVTDIPIPPDYMMGPGDVIKIILYGNKNEQYTLQVRREGDIFLPEVGPVLVAGLTFMNLKETIGQIIENQFIGTQFGLTLGKLRSINIFVLGEAYQPGMYTVSSLSTLTNAIFASGGIKITGSLRDIQVKRNGRVLASFDFYKLLLNGDNSDDIRLMTGDIVFIPPITKTVAISGEVTRPGIYELKEGESIHDLIHYSGSLKPKADLNSIEIERINPSGNGFSLIHVDLNSISPSDFNLNNGDVLNIYSIVNTMQNTILMTGYAQRPGFYPWNEGMRISDLVNFPEDLLPMTDNNYLIIKRENKISGLYEIFQVDLEELFLLGNPDKDFILQEKDEIIFFSKIDPEIPPLDPESESELELEPESEEEDPTPTRETREELLLPILDLLERQTTPTEKEKTITLMGNMFYPGVYPLTNGMTLNDAFKGGGGLKELSYITDIELMRSSVDGRQHKTSKVNLGILNTEKLNLKLEPGDIINVKQISKAIRTAQISGEVFFPGVYPISENETVADLIARAGGLKDEAYIKAAVFQRKALREIELNRIRILQEEARRNILLGQASKNLGDETIIDPTTLETILDEGFDETLLLGRLIINLQSILERTSKDLVLEDGDMLRIPKLRQIVSVIGEVYVPNSHLFKEGLTTKNYINLSGGATEFADINATYIIKADGSIVRESENSRFFRPKSGLGAIETGDTIVLPVQIDQFSALTATAEITQIVYQMALAAAAVNSF